MEILKCKFCKVPPRVIHVSDLWYHYCPQCMHHGKYYCCGRTKESSANQWNDINQEMIGVKYDPSKPRRFYGT
jgi:hypothetical protein